MPFRFSYIAAVFAAAGVSGGSAAALDLENTIYLDVDGGRVTIEMRPDVAPMHVARIKELTRQGFYDGLTFHRVIDGFMAQTGDPRGDGTGGSGQNITAEFNQMPFERGVVGMARSQNPNSGDSQFFIMFEAAPHLNGQYTAWGKVIDGMEHVDGIKKGHSAMNGSVQNPDKILKMQVAADVK
jgi:peptidylprolyl isomerase